MSVGVVKRMLSTLGIRGIMDVSEAMRRKDGGVEIDVTVSPRSSRSGVGGVDEWRKRVIVRVKAPPLEGRANKEVASVFTDVTGFRAEVVAGMTSHQKTVLVKGDYESVLGALRKAL